MKTKRTSNQSRKESILSIHIHSQHLHTPPYIFSSEHRERATSGCLSARVLPADHTHLLSSSVLSLSTPPRPFTACITLDAVSQMGGASEVSTASRAWTSCGAEGSCGPGPPLGSGLGPPWDRATWEWTGRTCPRRPRWWGSWGTSLYLLRSSQGKVRWCVRVVCGLECDVLRESGSGAR